MCVLLQESIKPRWDDQELLSRKTLLPGGQQALVPSPGVGPVGQGRCGSLWEARRTELGESFPAELHVR